MCKKRKSFQHLPSEENPQFIEDGKKIYIYMKNKYPNSTCEDLDNILNGLCASLTCLMYESVDPDNRKVFLQLIFNILNKNT